MSITRADVANAFASAVAYVCSRSYLPREVAIVPCTDPEVRYGGTITREHLQAFDAFVSADALTMSDAIGTAFAAALIAYPSLKIVRISSSRGLEMARVAPDWRDPGRC